MNYPELENQRNILRSVHRRLEQGHDVGEYELFLRPRDLATIAEEIGLSEQKATMLFISLTKQGLIEANLGGETGMRPLTSARVFSLSERGLREIGELPDPAAELVNRLMEMAQAIEEQDLPPRQKTVAKQALDELIHFLRGLPPGVAVEIGGRFLG